MKGYGSGTFRDLEDRIGDQAMRLAVHRIRRIRGWRIDQAEDPPCPFINPVLEIVNVVVTLRLKVGLVRLGDVVGSENRPRTQG